MGLLPDRIFNKRIFELNESDGYDSVYALQAVNRADIKCMDLIRMESQVIAFVPEGEAEVLMTSQDSHVFATKKNDLPSTQISSTKNIFIINHESWLDAGQLRSDYIYKYSDFPVGTKVSSTRLKVADWDAHEDMRLVAGDSEDPFTGEVYDPNYGYIKTCYYEALNKRIRLPEPASQGGEYLTWNARIRPAYMNAGESKTYRIRTPSQYRDMLEHFVKKQITPDGSQSMQLLKRDEPNVISMALNSIDPPARTVSMPWEI